MVDTDFQWFSVGIHERQGSSNVCDVTSWRRENIFLFIHRYHIAISFMINGGIVKTSLTIIRFLLFFVYFWREWYAFIQTSVAARDPSVIGVHDHQTESHRT